MTLPLLLVPSGKSMVAGAAFMSIVFGGIQYVFFAFGMFYLIGKKRNAKEIQKLTLVSPLMFVPIQALGWMTWGGYQKLMNPSLGGLWEPALPFALYSLAIGYMYVGIANIFYLALKKCGFMSDLTH